jgi:multicomponent Na+:H+ antiporter subunit D
MTSIPVGLIFIFGALLLPLFKGSARKIYLLILPIVAFLDLLSMPQGTFPPLDFMDLELVFARVDKLSMVFGYVFVIMAFIANLYALHVKDTGQHMAAMMYAGSALGVVFSGDYFTLFIFWELMAISSVWLIWLRRTEASLRAGCRYLLVHVAGGLFLLAGILLMYNATGSIVFDQVNTFQMGLATWLILIGFLINAAAPPMNAWLTDAYPEATLTGTVFLSAFTTKTAVYVLLRAFPGTEVLIWLGAIMALYGAFYAVLENDIRRLLSYSIISQVGYMVAGVGIGTMIAINGAASHAFTHILYKGLLLMGAGAVIHMTGKNKLTDLGGLYKTMPITLSLYMVGGLAISAFPLFSGFVSKSMIITAAGEEHLGALWLILTTASVGTFVHTGLKLPWFTFFGNDKGIKAEEPPKNMLAAMGMAALLCIGIGIYPQALYGELPYQVDFAPYTAEHVVWSLEILLFAALGFFVLLDHIKPDRTISLDTDWFYRKGAGVFMWSVTGPFNMFRGMVAKAGSVVYDAADWSSKNPIAALKIALGQEKKEGFPDIPQYLEVVSSNAAFTLVFLSGCIAVFLFGGGP